MADDKIVPINVELKEFIADQFKKSNEKSNDLIADQFKKSNDLIARCADLIDAKLDRYLAGSAVPEDASLALARAIERLADSLDDIRVCQTNIAMAKAFGPEKIGEYGAARDNAEARKEQAVLDLAAALRDMEPKP